MSGFLNSDIPRPRLSSVDVRMKLISGDVLNRSACLGVRRLIDMMTDRTPWDRVPQARPGPAWPSV